MTHTPAQIMVKLLVDANVVGRHDASSWPCFVGTEPATPANTVTCYDTTGIIEGRLFKSGRVVSHPGVQIRVRSEDYSTAYTKAKAIADALDVVKRRNVSLTGAQYTVSSIKRLQDPLYIGLDEKKRWPLFTINTRLTILP